ncbi:hypothetical protein A4D02_29195 [Niastella koreensis]|uniref:Uncharacterized protein n=2 Tax=Niastella koreensis TaxID=354356 RepID=G8TRA2_NIAKG|nr:hypothetical protein [Niastella koreensis]AEW00024.1 hypothetical protein Niako_3727 [Niastella koreensis GR20-10]OQP49665.1 hypothetical protein A4D02_29195 [Niastella koreensis]
MKQKIWSLSQFLVVILLIAGLFIQSCSKKVGDAKPDDGTPVETDVLKLIPDSMFRVYLKTNICPDAFDKTGKLIDITNPEVKDFAGTLKIDTITCPRPFVQSLKGIQYFTKMKKLYVRNSLVDSLDLSATMALDTVMLVTNTDMQYLSVSGCTSMRFIRVTDMPATTLNLSNLPALNYVNLISLKRMSTLKTDNDANLRHLMTYALQSLKTVNVTSNTELRRMYLEACGALTSLDVTKNRKLNQLTVTYSGSLKSVDLSKSDSLQHLSFEGSGVDTIDLSHNAKLISCILMWTPIRSVSTLGNPSLHVLWLDGATQLKTLDLRAQTNWDYYFIPENQYNNSNLSYDDGYMIVQDGRFSPVKTAEYTGEALASRIGVNGATSNIYAGLRAPQFLDASGITLASVKMNDAVKDNYSLVMARNTNGFATPAQIIVYAGDQTTILCNDYDPKNFKCN